MALHEVTWCMVVWCTQNLRRDGSRFMWHQPCQRCKYTTSVDIQKHAMKKLVTRVESDASSVSLLESGEQRYIKAIIICGGKSVYPPPPPPPHAPPNRYGRRLCLFYFLFFFVLGNCRSRAEIMGRSHRCLDILADFARQVCDTDAESSARRSRAAGHVACSCLPRPP